MARLIDELLRLDLSLEYREWFMSAVVIRGDNVAEYYFAGTPKADWHLTDFPNCAPPFAHMFVDFRHPSGSLEAGNKFTKWSEENSPFAWAWDVRIEEPLGQAQEAGIKWSVVARLIVQSRHNSVPTPFVDVMFFVAKDGAFISPYADGSDGMMLGALEFTPEPLRHIIEQSRHDIEGNTISWGWHDAQEKEDFESELNFVRRLLEPMLLAISFMHCKNVVIRAERAPDWQQKVAQKRHQHPLVSFRVLDIEPMKKVLRMEGQVQHNGLKRAIHICRGHFKTYTADKPLFGRIAGTFWWEPSVRGSKERGIALKDYNVKMPRS